MDDKPDVAGSCTPCQDPASHSSHHKICYICQDSTGILVRQPQHDSYERFLQGVKSGALYGDHKYISISDRLGIHGAAPDKSLSSLSPTAPRLLPCNIRSQQKPTLSSKHPEFAVQQNDAILQLQS